MLRELTTLPTAPARLLEDIHEIKLLVRELLSTEEDLTETSRSMDSKMDKLDTANERLERALEQLRGFNEKLDRLDGRLVGVQAELRAMRSDVHEIADLVPEMNRGPIDKVKDAIAGE